MDSVGDRRSFRWFCSGSQSSLIIDAVPVGRNVTLMSVQVSLRAFPAVSVHEASRQRSLSIVRRAWTNVSVLDWDSTPSIDLYPAY